jgi:gamma-glutamylcyclotransferase (GGCT)/AIG2-like uncharacterized protein YtfP
MKHLFAYGTLMCGEIMAEVSGASLPASSAILRGYRRRGVKGRSYPALVPGVESHVEGVVYRDVPPSAWARLDRFEGQMYSREPVRVELADGSVVAAATYVARAEFLDCLGEEEWDFAAFLIDGKESFRRSYEGYLAL